MPQELSQSLWGRRKQKQESNTAATKEKTYSGVELYVNGLSGAK